MEGNEMETNKKETKLLKNVIAPFSALLLRNEITGLNTGFQLNFQSLPVFIYFYMKHTDMINICGSY